MFHATFIPSRWVKRVRWVKGTFSWCLSFYKSLENIFWFENPVGINVNAVGDEMEECDLKQN